MEDLPSELIEMIVVLLDLPNICSIRLVSRQLSSKATQEHFRSFFRARRVYLEQQSLQEFAHATRRGGLGCLLTRLEVIGIAAETSCLEDGMSYGDLDESGRVASPGTAKGTRDRHRDRSALRNAKNDARLLGEAFNNIGTASAVGGLESLSLKVHVLRHASDRLDLPVLHVYDPGVNEEAECGADRDAISRTAAETFAAAAESLVASRLRVWELIIFNGTDMQRCSLAAAALKNINSLYPRLRYSLTSLRKLSLSLSRHRDEISSDLVGLTRLLQIAPGLRELEVHVFIADRALDWRREDHMRLLAAQKHLPQLTSCRLRGLYVSVTDLCTFVQKTRPRSLHLKHITARSGTWKTFFDFLATAETNVEDLYMEDLFERQHLIFDEPGTLKYGPKSERGTHTLARHGEEVARPIAYHFSQSRMLGIPGLRLWREQATLEYGLTHMHAW